MPLRPRPASTASKGFPETIKAVYAKTAVQLCLVHMVRHSLNYVSWKMRKAAVSFHHREVLAQ